MSSKRKAASGPAAVAADIGDAHTAKRRKLPVSPATADLVVLPLLVVDGLVVGWRKSTSKGGIQALFCSLDWIWTHGWDAANIILHLH